MRRFRVRTRAGEFNPPNPPNPPSTSCNTLDARSDGVDFDPPDPLLAVRTRQRHTPPRAESRLDKLTSMNATDESTNTSPELSPVEVLATDFEHRFRKSFVFIVVPLATKSLSLNLFRCQPHTRRVGCSIPAISFASRAAVSSPARAVARVGNGSAPPAQTIAPRIVADQDSNEPHSPPL